jgi:hypothetical protein
MAAPLPDYTPEEMATILAKHKKNFTCEKLIEYMEDDIETFPAEDVIAEMEEMIRRSKQIPGKEGQNG